MIPLHFDLAPLVLQSSLICCMCHSMIFLPSPGLSNHSDLSQCSNQSNQTFEIGSRHLPALSLGWKNTSSFSKFLAPCCPSKKKCLMQRKQSKCSISHRLCFLPYGIQGHGFPVWRSDRAQAMLHGLAYLWSEAPSTLQESGLGSVLLTLRPRTSRQAQE